jgi:hypothetical protein
MNCNDATIHRSDPMSPLPPPSTARPGAGQVAAKPEASDEAARHQFCKQLNEQEQAYIKGRIESVVQKLAPAGNVGGLIALDPAFSPYGMIASFGYAAVVDAYQDVGDFMQLRKINPSIEGCPDIDTDQQQYVIDRKKAIGSTLLIDGVTDVIGVGTIAAVPFTGGYSYIGTFVDAAAMNTRDFARADEDSTKLYELNHRLHLVR